MADGGGNGIANRSAVTPAILSGVIALLVSAVIGLVTYGREQGVSQTAYTDLERRIVNVETNAANKNDVTEAVRRLATVEQGGSQPVQALKLQTDVADRRLSTLEANVGSHIQNLLTANATQDARISAVEQELLRVRRWREEHSKEDSMDHAEFTALRAEVENLRRSCVLKPDAPSHGGG